MEEEVAKSIKILLDYSDENGVRSKKDMSVKINTAVLKDKSQPSYMKSRLIYTLSFSLKIPDHIHSALIGKTVPVFGISRARETKDYPIDFSKTVSATNIEGLTERWWEIIYDYEWLKESDTRDLKKMIFYSFGSNNSEWKSYHSSIYFGKSSKINYNYCIGYTYEINGRKVRFNSDKKLISDTNDKDFYDLKFMEYSEERKIFFDSIQQTFEAIIERISFFGEGLSEETVNDLISNKIKLIS